VGAEFNINLNKYLYSYRLHQTGRGRRETIMADKLLQLVVQIAICISLLWLTKEMAGKFSIALLVIAYILSYVLTKAVFYCIGQWKIRAIKIKSD